MKKILQKLLLTFLSFVLISANILPIFDRANTNLIKKIYADNSCTAESMDPRSYLSSRVGGVALDQAAVFLADLTDLNGAYYDADQDRIVFIGSKTNTSLPKFDKDDLAVAIKSLVFNNQIPAVSMENKDPYNPFQHENLNVLFYGGIEDTNFGKVLVEADYKMKQYAHGYNENGQRITSSVPGYKSFFDRFLEKNPTSGINSYSRWWISPQLITLKKDDTSKSFVFDQVKMQIETEGLWPTNDPKWNEAAVEFAQQQTALYDQFAQETPSYMQAKQLAKIVGVVKWIKDNNVVNNFEWARDYQPKYVHTPREIRRLTTPEIERNGTRWRLTGGVTYDEPNTYSVDSGTSSSLKNSSEAVGTSSETNHWTFTNSGKQYEAVSVEANAFRSLGAYSTSETDMSFPTAGDQELSFGRSYSSFSGGQKGIGRGWDFMPVRLYDSKTGWYVNCTSGAIGKHPYKVAFTGSSGITEFFTYNNCSAGYSADKSEYHSKLTHNSDGTLTIKTTDQTEYLFDAAFKLISSKDKFGNKINYSYDGLRVSSISDTRGHTLSLNYQSNGLISSVSDWTGRKIQYAYDTQSNLTGVIDPRGNTLRYEYNSDNKLSKVFNRNGQIALENTYTLDSKLASQKNSSGVSVNFTYDETTKTINSVDTNGRIGKANYDDKARITQSTDALNNSLKFTYGIEPNPLTTTDKKGNKTTFAYDSSGNLTSATFPNGKKITHTYNTKNQVTKISDGRYSTTKVTDNTYDSSGKLTQTSESGVITKFTYDSYGEVISSTNNLNNTSNFERNNFGNITSIKNPAGNQKLFEFDALARLTKETDEEGKITNYSYDQNGNLIAVSNSSGTSRYEYTQDNLTSRLILPNNSVTDYFYNTSLSLAQTRDSSGNTTNYSYDNYQNLISQQDSLNNSTNFTYDILNRQTEEKLPMGQTTKFEYDPNSNITKKTDALGRPVAYSFTNMDQVSRITYPSASSSFTYDYRGNMTKMTDTLGSTSYTYDNFDRLTKVTNPYSRNVSYAYDSLGRLTQLTYPDSKNVNYTYDNSDRLISVKDWNSKNTNYSYFKNNLTQSMSLPNGITSNYTYDGSNRLSSLEYVKSGSVLAKFIYERNSLGDITKVTEEGSFFSQALSTPTPTPTTATTPTPTIRLSQTPTPTSAPTPTPFTSNTPTPTPTGSSGNPDLIVTGISVSKNNPSAGENISISVTVKNIGTLATTNSFRVGFYYDRTTAPNSSTSSDDYESYYSDVAPDQEVTVTQSLVDFEPAGTHNIWAFVDRNLDISEVSETNNAFGPYNLNVLAASNSFFEKFATSFITPLKNILKANMVYAQTAQFISTFTYDPLGRLINAKYTDGKDYSYSYDKNHNRTQQNINSVLTDYAYNPNNQLTQFNGFNLSYDAVGNMTTKTGPSSGQSLSYDLEDNVTSVTPTSGSVIKYAYDGLGNRLSKTVGSAATRYVNDFSGALSNVLVETNSLNTIQKYYVYGLDLISQGGSTSTSQQYFIKDGLGNVRFTTDSSGNRIKSFSYDPFGNIRSQSTGNDTNYRFSGEQSEQETGLYFLRARYYDPQTGRFISRDPIKGTMMDSRTQNPYIYTANNPINYSDPSGESMITDGLMNWSKILLPKATSIGQKCLQFIKNAKTVPTSQKIITTESRLQHVTDGHTAGGVSSAGKSVFSSNTDIQALVRQAEGAKTALQPGGNYERVVDAGKTIGLDRTTGQPTSIYTIITDKYGNLVTAFPGKP